MLETMLEGVQRRLAAAVVVGMLTLGAPAGRFVPPVSPPAVVRVQTAAAGPLVWRELFPYRPAPDSLN